MPDYKLTGPKGGTLVKRAPLARVRAILPALVRRFGHVSVYPAPAAPVLVDHRAQVVAWAKRGVAQEPLIHYAEVRPMPLNWTVPPGLTTDCSGFATLCYKLAGCADPNGLGYNGTGFTGTLLQHGHSVSTPLPGDLVFYGPGDAFHVAVVVEGGTDPLTVSHGQEKGPELVRVSQDNRQPVRYRSYL